LFCGCDGFFGGITVELVLYRAMCEEEFKILKERGFRSTFRKGWKFFSTNPEYTYIVTHELNYNLIPDVKYARVVRFTITLRDVPGAYVRFFTERDYTNVMINCGALPFISSVTWKEIDKDALPRPKPALTWITKSGRVAEVFSLKKARQIWEKMKSARQRVLYVDPVLCDSYTCVAFQKPATG